MVILAFLDDVIILFPADRATQVLGTVQGTFKELFGLALTLSKCLFYLPSGATRPGEVPAEVEWTGEGLVVVGGPVGSDHFVRNYLVRDPDGPLGRAAPVLEKLPTLRSI